MSDDKDYLWDGTGSDEDVERLEASLGGLRYDRTAPVATKAASRLWVYVAAAVLLVGVAYGAFALTSRVFEPTGPPSYILGEGAFDAGSWIETGASKARVQVADIGYVDVHPRSRIQAVRSGSTEHRLHLERGRIHAKINAPPRLFIVDTPSATAVDQGCEYTLEVDEDGNGLLRVTLGWVNLELEDGLAEVPRGAACESRKDAGLGIPYFEDATSAFRHALSDLTFGDDPKLDAKHFQTVLDESREKDSLTLWHLLREAKQQFVRKLLVGKLMEHVPLPTGVTFVGLWNGDDYMLGIYEDEIKQTWW